MENKMENKMKNVILLFLLLSYHIFAQSKGTIQGKVFDAETGEELIGVNILVLNTDLGTTTDFEGFYAIKNLKEGIYDLKFSYVSYQNSIVKNVKVEGGKITSINVQLKPTATQLQEVVISAEATKSTEGVLLKIQKNSINVMDVASAELIKKNNSKDGADIIKRMSGVVLSEGRFAIIRGVGDRYNNTILNGATAPSSEPEKKSFSYDILPASLIDNVQIAKTFTPDKPGDFSGGLAQISTKDIPEKTSFDFSYSSGYNPSTTGKNFKTYSGGKYDFIGLDDGARKYPSLIGSKQVLPSNYNPAELVEIGKSFKNNWNTKTLSAPINSSVKLAFGDRYSYEDNYFGLIGSINYTNEYEAQKAYRSDYSFDGQRFSYNGFQYSNNIAWSAMLNFSAKVAKRHKINFRNLYSVTSENETYDFNGFYRNSSQFRKITNLKFLSRDLLTSQISGENAFDFANNLKVDWSASFSQASRNEPDNRRYIYARDYDDDSEPMRFLMDQSISTRFYGEQKDKLYNGNINFEYKFSSKNNSPKIKSGIFYETKDRNYSARIFGFRLKPGGNFFVKDSVLQLSVDKIFVPENFGPNFIEITEITKPNDSYKSDQNVSAAYVMTEFSISDNIKFSGGFRYEFSKLNMFGYDWSGNEVKISKTYGDILSSLSIIYSLFDNSNLRLAYGKTLARPEFREVAPYGYYNIVTDNITYGNPKLEKTNIHNYDIKLETFPSPGELISIGGFYKKFQKPIELIMKASSDFYPSLIYKNADEAYSYGVEFEVRKNLSFLSAYLSEFSIVNNLSLIKSEINIENAIVKGYTKSKRPLQGQSDFTINFGIYYDNQDLGLNSSLTYNKVGEKIYGVGFGGLGDVKEMPRNLIDFSISKSIFNNLLIKFIAKDILGENLKYIQETPEGKKIVGLYDKNTSYSLGISYSF